MPPSPPCLLPRSRPQRSPHIQSLPLPDPPRRCVRGGPPRPGCGQPTWGHWGHRAEQRLGGRGTWVHRVLRALGWAGLGLRWVVLHTALYPSITCCDFGRPAGLTLGKKAPSLWIVFKKISAPLLPPPKASAASFFSLKPPFPRARDPIFPNPFPNPPTNLLRFLPQDQTTFKHTCPNQVQHFLGVTPAELTNPTTPSTLVVVTTTTTTTSTHPPPPLRQPTAATVAAASKKRNVHSPRTIYLVGV